jgi:hypothetical protein
MDQEQVLEIRKRISTSDTYGLPFYFSFEKVLRRMEPDGSSTKSYSADLQLNRVPRVEGWNARWDPQDLVDGSSLTEAHHEED